MVDGAYMNFLVVYTRSMFQDFENDVRNGVVLVEDEIRLVLN